VRSGRREAAGEAPGSSLLTLDGDIVGTPQYMAPEQAAGHLAQLGPAADVYAVGAMLYHVLAGRAPYEGRECSSPAELLAAVRREPPRPLHELASGVPAELSAVCEKAMSREVAQRYASVAALGEDLRAFLESRVVTAYEAGPLAELRKWVRRNRALSAASAAVLLAVIGGLLWASHVESVGRERAEAARRDADRALANVLRLSDVQRLERLRRDADELWPADPEHVGPLQAWLDEARSLLARTAAHRSTLEELRLRAEPYSAEDQRRDREDPRLAAELAAEQASLAALEPMLADDMAHPDPDPAHRAVILRKLEARRAAIERVQATLAQRRSFRFASEEDGWWSSTLVALLDGLQRFGAMTVPALEQRLQRAQDLRRLSLDEPAALWQQALASIADPAQCPAYSGLSLAPQRGLVPLGRNPRTGLWEFRDVQLGEAPLAGEDGRWIVRPETGVIFVLLPGGRALCGSQSSDPLQPNYDRFEPRLTRVVEARLDAFFIAAHEITQAQWERAMPRNPSLYQAPTSSAGNVYTETNPVESITWAEARTFAGRFGWTLPTEAQWEYACRAGTTTRWWTGPELASLQGAENLADAWLDAHGGAGWEHDSVLDDGHSASAPVGSFRPNAFGLFDMGGNLGEWMRDNAFEIAQDFREGDGLQAGGNADAHPVRGGDWSTPAAEATSAHRSICQSELRSDKLGLRVVRAVEPARD
jgi:formylglycine-generating enzyme required for sulfatase activity